MYIFDGKINKVLKTICKKKNFKKHKWKEIDLILYIYIKIPSL